MKQLTVYQCEKLLLLRHLSPTNVPQCSHPGCKECRPAFLEFHHINGDGYKHRVVRRGKSTGGMKEFDLKKIRLSGRAKEILRVLCIEHHREADRESGFHKSSKRKYITNIDTPAVSFRGLKIDWDFQERIDKLNPL